MPKFKVGEICIINKNNDIVPMSSDKIIYVKVKEIVRNIFFMRIYRCQICDREGNILNETPLNCLAKHLHKLEDWQVVVVRYPEDIPIINEEDVKLIKLMNAKWGDQLSEHYQERITMLILKLELFSKVINEY